jgi:LacI family transcriptional regulator
MACNDLRALQVIHAAQTVGLLVPEEVAVLGANNDEARCDLAYPPLSSVATNAHLSGYKAAELLDALMRGETPPERNLRIDPSGVVTRRSSDILAIADRNVAGAIAYIREHACTGISVDSVLEHVALSRSQLEKRFRTYLGRSPQAEIRRIQVTRIKQLLMETDFPLKKIADLTGFEHVEYMCVVFNASPTSHPATIARSGNPPKVGNGRAPPGPARHAVAKRPCGRMSLKAVAVRPAAPDPPRTGKLRAAAGAARLAAARCSPPPRPPGALNDCFPP